MRGASNIFYVLLGLLMVDALFEMSFVSATVGFLHNRAGRAFEINYNGGSFSLHGKPEFLLVDQGHVSNGAAGTALILVGIGGFLTFPFLRRDLRTGHASPYSRFVLIFWPIASFLSMLLTFAAFVYTQVVTSKHSGQAIDERVASQLNNQAYPDYVAYPLDTWTPENWFDAILHLDLQSSGDRSLIQQKYNVIKGWRWNLIPMFVLGVAVFALGFVEARKRKAEFVRNTSLREKSKEHDLESSDDNQAAIPMLKPVCKKPVPKYGPGPQPIE